MMYSEFTELSRRNWTMEDYKVIEFVYTFHPSISVTDGKNQIVFLADELGMRFIKDMLPTAEKNKKLEDEIFALKTKLSEKSLEQMKLRYAEI